MPSGAEQLALADVRAYSLVSKTRVPGQPMKKSSRSALRGHMIAFVHDGLSEVSVHFDEARMRNVLRHLQLMFVGPAGKIGRLEQRALQQKDFVMRSHVLCYHLAIRSALGHLAADLPPVCDIAKLLADVTVRLAENTHYVADDRIERRSKPRTRSSMER